MKTCNYCDSLLLQRNFDSYYEYKRAKYCNKDCYQKDHSKRYIKAYCLFCDKEFETQESRPKIFCSLKCRYDHNKRDGSTYVGVNGYRYVKVHGHPNGAQSNYWMLEHRHVMEQHLGRYLTFEETVHHKDGNKLNNALENLEVLSNSAHVKLHNELQVKTQGYASINSDWAIHKRAATRRQGY